MNTAIAPKGPGGDGERPDTQIIFNLAYLAPDMPQAGNASTLVAMT